MHRPRWVLLGLVGMTPVTNDYLPHPFVEPYRNDFIFFLIPKYAGQLNKIQNSCISNILTD